MRFRVGHLRRLWSGPPDGGRRVPVSQPPFAPLRPARPLVVIGDVHGCLPLLERLLARAGTGHPEADLVLVGDLIDRGEQSAGVLRLAFERRRDLTVLLGNHEEMLLHFLDAPETQAVRWFRNGGLQTMASFGIGPIGAAPDPDLCRSLRDRLRAALGEEIEAWLRSLPRLWQSGNVVVTHAGADPWLPITQQSAQALTWGAAEFGHRRRTDGIWVVHGHVIVEAGRCGDGVISVDTGAFASGRLTAALISEGQCDFLSETA